MKAAEIAKTIEDYAPISSGTPGDELGFIHGDAAMELTGLTVCWSPTLDVIRASAEQGRNMIVSHEPLLFQKRWSVDAEAKDTWFDEREDAEKVVNKNRLAALREAGICVYRAHSNWDPAPKIGIVDALATRLGFGPPMRRGRYTTLHRLAPVTVGALTALVRERLRAGPLRVLGDLDRKVERVGLMVGGLGQMFNSPEELHMFGAEAIVAGECLAYTFWTAKEHGLAMIEAGHGASENPGMEAMADWLARKFPALPVKFMDSGEAWTVVS